MSEEVTEDQINKKIGVNQEILIECGEIERLVVNAFEVGHQIEENLDGIINLRISEIQDKYDYKYESIAKCDDLFDATNLQIESIGSQLELNINLAKELIKKLEE